MQIDIYNRLNNAYDGAERCKKIEAMLAQMMIDKRKLEEALPEYKRALAKENLDVYKLESEGVSSFLSSVFGDRDKMLQKERGEAVIARLKCRQVEKELDEINGCIESLEAERKKLEGCGEEYRRLYKQKLQVMIRENGPMAERIMELVEDIRKAKALLKELSDAAAAGQNAMRYLRSAHDNLTKAESYGVYDMAGSGKKGESMLGFIAGRNKYNHIDSAVIDAGIAQSAINGFKSELADLNIKFSNPDIDLKPDKFVRFIDRFQDSLTADFASQQRIYGSLNSVNMSKDDVQQKLTMLKTLELETQRRLDELKSKLDYIILGLKPDREKLTESIMGLLE